jgi:hypothetical protein
MTMRNSILQKTAALAVAGAVLFGAAAPSLATPVPSAVASLNNAVTSPVTDVRWRGRRGWGGGIAAGLAAGLIVGGIAAASNPYYYQRRGYYYGPRAYPYYREPVYVEPPVVYYEAPPAYYVAAPRSGPNGPARQCWVATDKDRGFGYWRPC